MLNEIWKNIQGFSGYQVSNLGRVRTHNKTTYTIRHGIRHWKDRILKQKIRKDNCCQVNLWRDGESTTHYVHRLVAETFLGIPNDDMTINHKDGNRLNNCVTNLEWLSRADNIRHGFNNNLYSTQKKCTLMDCNGKTYDFTSLSKASKFLGRSHTYISNRMKHNGRIYDINNKEYMILIDYE